VAGSSVTTVAANQSSNDTNGHATYLAASLAARYSSAVT
jgi:hypothetical protein